MDTTAILRSAFLTYLRTQSASDKVDCVLNKAVETDAPCASDGGRATLTLLGVTATGEGLEGCVRAWIETAEGSFQ